MYKKLIVSIMALSLFACSEPPKKEEITEEIKASPTTPEEPRYQQVEKTSELVIAIPSELSRLERIESKIEKELGVEIQFVKRHFFTDNDVFNPNEFDLIIAEPSSSLAQKAKNAHSVGVLIENRIVLAAGSLLSQSLGDTNITSWENVYQAASINNTKIAITNPGWDISAHTAWMSWVKNNSAAKMEQITTFPNGHLTFAVDKLLNKEIDGLWITEGLARHIQHSFENEKKEKPFEFYKISDPSTKLAYETLLINKGKENMVREFHELLTSEEGASWIKEKMYIDRPVAKFASSQFNMSHSDKLSSIDGFLDRNFPNVQTFLLVPNTSLGEINHISGKIEKTFSSLKGSSLNTLETISKIRKGEGLSIYGYDNVAKLSYETKDLSSTSLDSIRNAVSFSQEKRSEEPDPYAAIAPIFIEAATFKKNNPDYFVKLIIVITDGYEGDSEYAEFAEEYKRIRPNHPELFEIPIDAIVLGEASRENLNGIAGLSRGYVLDADKNQFKRSFLILRNHF